MSAEGWLQAARTEEERLFAEIAKTTLYKQLEAVRAVIVLYERTAETAETLEQDGVTVVATHSGGAVSSHSFKVANAFGGLSDAVAGSSSQPRSQ
jgi:hypothetical protein